MPEVKGYEVNFASHILPFFEIFMSWNMLRNSKNAGNSMRAFIFNSFIIFTLFFFRSLNAWNSLVLERIEEQRKCQEFRDKMLKLQTLNRWRCRLRQHMEVEVRYEVTLRRRVADLLDRWHCWAAGKRIYAMRVVWTCHTFSKNFRMKHEFEKYLKESCR